MTAATVTLERAHTFTFRPLLEDDVPLLHEWIQRISLSTVEMDGGSTKRIRASAASISFWPMSASSDKDLERKW